LIEIDGRTIGTGRPGRVAVALKEELKREFIGE
jgi:hypothetical protein